jgi:DNA-binding ferritin-like protein
MLKRPSEKAKIKRPALIKKDKLKGGMKPVYESVAELIDCISTSISQLQRFHWNTRSYAAHIALGELYGCLQEHVDCLAEQFIICCGKDIESPKGHTYYKTFEELIYALKEKAREAGCDDRGINNVIDDICTTLNAACYKLERLK